MNVDLIWLQKKVNARTALKHYSMSIPVDEVQALVADLRAAREVVEAARIFPALLEQLAEIIELEIGRKIPPVLRNPPELRALIASITAYDAALSAREGK